MEPASIFLIGEWLYKLAYACYRILLSNEEEWTINHLDESLENYIEQEKPISKICMPYHSIYIIFLKWQNFRKGEEAGSC